MLDVPNSFLDKNKKAHYFLKKNYVNENENPGYHQISLYEKLKKDLCKINALKHTKSSLKSRSYKQSVSQIDN